MSDRFSLISMNNVGRKEIPELAVAVGVLNKNKEIVYPCRVQEY